VKERSSGHLATITDEERRMFLKLGLKITGVMAGGSILSLMSVEDRTAHAYMMDMTGYVKNSYKPHYCMVIRQNHCVDCEKCKEACVKTNHVPSYGWRTNILEKKVETEDGDMTLFMPVLCNHCMNPPCVRVCPTNATYKDEKTGIVMMDYDKCIGCKTCMAACPYNARYFKEENRAIDKCNFCYDTRLSKGEKLTACAEACPANVRVFGDLKDKNSKPYKLIHDPNKVVWVLRPETGAKPTIFYIND
jgi:protein NrfC